MAETKPPKSKLYTRTGDGGESSLYNGTRCLKDEAVFEALGSVDELSAALGVAREFCSDEMGLDEHLAEVQCRLIEIGSNIATPKSSSTEEAVARVAFGDGAVAYLEKEIDALDSKLPTLTKFILPSGGKASAFLHVARTACRRAERRVQPCVRSGDTDEAVGKYLNRLSDYLFAAARYAAMVDGCEEVTYKKSAA